MNDSDDDKLVLPSWRFSVARLGCLQSGDIEVKPLTLLCGPNNAGKTWVMYALYGFLERPFSLPPPQLPGLEEVITVIKQEGSYSWDFGAWLTQNAKKLIDLIHRGTQRRLPLIFNAPDEVFRSSRFDWGIDPQVLVKYGIKRTLDFRLVLGRDKNDALRLLKPSGEPHLQITLLAERFPDLNDLLSDIVLRHLLGGQERRSVFLMPAERNGLHLFFRELSDRRTTLLHHARKEKLDVVELFRDVMGSRYAEPIAHYIDWLNLIRIRRKEKRGPFHSLAEQVKKLVGGRYDVDTEGSISFTPRKLRKGGDDAPKLDLHLTSSTVKSLFGLWFYLEHQAQPGDVLMIDEPELNLHPSNQRAVARLLARFVNAGLRVVCSTHSDYLVREINSLIMLNRPHSQHTALMNRFGYLQEEVLNPEEVGAYLFDENRLESMKVTEEEGIIAETFDTIIHELNETSDEIYYAYQNDGSEGEA